MGQIIVVGPYFSPRRMERINTTIRCGEAEALDFSNTTEYSDKAIEMLADAIKATSLRPRIKAMDKPAFEKLASQVSGATATAHYVLDKTPKCPECQAPTAECKCESEAVLFSSQAEMFASDEEFDDSGNEEFDD